MTRRFDPYRQGELDSLCGIYAVINAVAVLCPEIEGDFAADLFRKLVRSLARGTSPGLGAVYDGLSQEAIERFIAIAAREIQRVLVIRIAIKAFPEPPTTPTLPELWASLRKEIRPRQVAILGLSGLHDHWTVAYAVTEQLIRLVDSSDRHVLVRSRCTTRRARSRFRLDPAEIILVRRAGR